MCDGVAVALSVVVVLIGEFAVGVMAFIVYAVNLQLSPQSAALYEPYTHHKAGERLYEWVGMMVSANS